MPEKYSSTPNDSSATLKKNNKNDEKCISLDLPKNARPHDCQYWHCLHLIAGKGNREITLGQSELEWARIKAAN